MLRRNQKILNIFLLKLEHDHYLSTRSVLKEVHIEKAKGCYSKGSWVKDETIDMRHWRKLEYKVKLRFVLPREGKNKLQGDKLHTVITQVGVNWVIPYFRLSDGLDYFICFLQLCCGIVLFTCVKSTPVMVSVVSPLLRL